MCGIAGVIALTKVDACQGNLIMRVLGRSIDSILPRGPDALGYTLIADGATHSFKTPIPGRCTKEREANGLRAACQVKESIAASLQGTQLACLLINARGVPTTESGDYAVQHLSEWEIQPFMDANQTMAVVHNGTVANDAALSQGKRWMPDSLFDKYPSKDIDTYSLLTPLSEGDLDVTAMEGSFALAAWKDGHLTLARNYLGLHLMVVVSGGQALLFFSSEPFDDHLFAGDAYDTLGIQSVHIKELPPYSSLQLDAFSFSVLPAAGLMAILEGRLQYQNKRDLRSAVVSLSGGLDSTVVATYACTYYDTVHLMHFQYGCRASDRELEAVQAILAYLRAKFPEVRIHLQLVDMRWLKGFGGSRLFDAEDTIQNGDKGAELATEWVPARNLCMTSVAAAYCDANNIGTILLGVNREESAAYCDNSTEFYTALNRALDLGTQSRPQTVSVLGNLMKHHIWQMGKQLGAPLHLTWSCYRNGEGSENLRCGVCGPCMNTSRAASMNGDTTPWQHNRKD